MNLLAAARAAHPQTEAGVPVFMFHRVNPLPAGANWPELYVHPATFRNAVEALAAAGVTAVGPAGALAAAGEAGAVCAFTFDDGFRSALEHAGPALAALGFSAINYLVADRLGRSNEWDVGIDRTPEPLMDRGQVAEWLAMGHDIGAHTLTHPHLDRVSPTEAREEIGASKRKLEDLFGRTIRHFAYPWGHRNAAVAEMVQAAGYATACTTEAGLVGSGAAPFNLPRLNVDDRALGAAEPFTVNRTRAGAGDGT